ncbi:hypothetical protein LOZ61_003415 [Ophidiomyces ophidiicola]|nr:hypothetical protein LOZ61_003415 [Ophidiomyces ophidiicola]KAI1920522.1 hypothetical protein LOZ64_001838 [Ophidiomyces ophidiicola]KAI1924153.1 hypothetical protein LOZ60_004833 [Ophidiomyces ophidiicola]KAI2007204.1 hypothetical protein LOZ50_002679 [Ophidiomyces ophidiicola]KAI2010030.1 hypothetical protein LOZ49_003606 [Ophidiomyces ophidiicola]
MATLHTALESLKPTSIDEIPTDHAELSLYIKDLLVQARLIVESVPEPRLLSSDANPAFISSSNGALKNSAESLENVSCTKNPPALRASSSTPAVDASDIAAWQKEWGKPFNKVENAKDNPMRIPIFKLKSKDGKGTWFARRSVHHGPLPYSIFRDKLRLEIPETMRIMEETGEASNIRGVGSERRLERRVVPKDPASAEAIGSNEDELGAIEVHHLSAHFPGPSSSRDFVTLLISSDRAVDVSQDTDEECSNEEQDASRAFVIISKPCKHPDAPEREGYVRGQYESVEMIRELRTMTMGNQQEGVGDKESPRPVEWTMVTRSDPGGSIPRWMVEKATVPSIVADTKKFMDWATRDQKDSSSPRSSIDSGQYGGHHKTRPESDTPADYRSLNRARSTEVTDHPGSDDGWSTSDIMPTRSTGFTTAMFQGLSSTLVSMAPRTLFDFINITADAHQSSDESSTTENDPGTENVGHRTINDDDSASMSYASVNSHPRDISKEVGFSEAQESKSSLHETVIDGESEPVVPGSAEGSIRSQNEDLVSANCDKEFSKLNGRKAQIIQELEANHEERNKLLTQISHPSTHRGTESKVETNAASHEKQLMALERKEGKLTSRLQKYDAQQQKIIAKIESKRRKESGKDAKRKLKAEIDTLKKQLSRAKSETDGLRKERSYWLSIVEKLQQENARLETELRKEKGVVDGVN